MRRPSRLPWSWALVSLAFLATLHVSHCFKALFVLPYPTRSHFGGPKALAEELVRRGHEVTVVSPFPQENATYKEIFVDTKPVENLMIREGVNMTELRTMNGLVSRYILWDKINSWAEEMVPAQALKELAASNEHYDVILSEISFFTAFVLPFGHKFGAPVVDLSPASPFAHALSFLGNPYSFSYIPETMVPVGDRMSYSERLSNMVNGLWDLFLYNWYILPSQEKMVRKHITYPGSENMPSLSDMVKNISVSLVNSHFSIGYPRPFAPNVIEVAGLHLKPVKKLPKELQEFMDTAENGVIYVSFGSVVRGAMLGEARVLAIADALKRLKHRVILKMDTSPEPFKGAKNILVLSWAPQQEILAHPKLVLFVTHGGFNSLVEATHAGVPVLGVPFFADQFRNILFYETRGSGKGFDLDTFTSDRLYESILHIVNTPSYRTNAKEIARRARDRPMSALDTAAFWVEYVVRHKGAAHLKPASLYLSFHQYILLDVIAPIFLVVFIAIKLIGKLCCSKSQTSKIRSKTDHKKKN